MVELKGTDVTIDGTEFQYTGEAIEPVITVKVNGTELVAGRDYSVTYSNNVEPGTATVTVRGIATASETLGYTGEVSIDYTITAPEAPTEPSKPVKPEKPGKPADSSKPGKPGQAVQATSELKILMVDYTGKTVATAKLTSKGNIGDTCCFKAQQILKAVNDNMPAKYAIVNEESVKAVETVYGTNNTVKIQVGKVATLKVTYISLLGRRVDVATITKVQTSDGPCMISAAEIKNAAPVKFSAIRFVPVMFNFGRTESITVTVF